MLRLCLRRRRRLPNTTLLPLLVLAALLATPTFPISGRSSPGGSGIVAPTASAAVRLHEIRAPAPMTPNAATSRLLEHRLVTTPLVAAAGANPLAGGPAGHFEGLAYASWDSSFYVATPPSSVDVISESTDAISAVIPVGNSPFGVVVDESSRLVFVTNSGSNNVTVINGSTHHSIANIAVGKSPFGVAYDDLNATVFVANNGSNSVTVIAVPTLSVVATLAVGSNPTSVAYYHARNRIYVANHGSNNVTVLSGVNPHFLGTVAVGRAPFGVGIDNATDKVYVTDEGANNITVFWAGNDTMEATILVPNYYGGPLDLQGLAYDSRNRMLFVGAGALWALVLNTTTDAIVDWIGSDPAGVAIDGGTGDVCFTNTANVTFGCFLFVTRPPPSYYNITFTESGLPVGANWSVTLGGSLRSSTTTSIVFVVVNSTWSYVVDPVASYSPVPGSGYVVVRGAPVTVTIGFLRGPTYPLTFVESGLPAGAAWYVNLSGRWNASSGLSIALQVPNGTYHYVSGPINARCYLTLTGPVNVSGPPSSVQLVFQRAPCGPPPCPSLNFSEGGLATGTNWSVTVTAGNSSMTRWTTGFYLFFDCPGSPLVYTVSAIGGYVVSPDRATLTLNTPITNVSLLYRLGLALTANASIERVAGDLCTPGSMFTVVFLGLATGGSPPYYYSWDFQDGSPVSQAQNPTHNYTNGPALGSFLAVLTVQDSAARSASSFVRPLVTSCPAALVPTFGPAIALALIVTGVGATVVIIAAAVYARPRPPPIR